MCSAGAPPAAVESTCCCGKPCAAEADVCRSSRNGFKSCTLIVEKQTPRRIQRIHMRAGQRGFLSGPVSGEIIICPAGRGNCRSVTDCLHANTTRSERADRRRERCRRVSAMKGFLRRCSPRQCGRRKSGTLSRLDGRRTPRSSAHVRSSSAHVRRKPKKPCACWLRRSGARSTSACRSPAAERCRRARRAPPRPHAEPRRRRPHGKAAELVRQSGRDHLPGGVRSAAARSSRIIAAARAARGQLSSPAAVQICHAPAACQASPAW